MSRLTGDVAPIRAGIDSIEHSILIDDEGIALAKQHGTFQERQLIFGSVPLSQSQDKPNPPERAPLLQV